MGSEIDKGEIIIALQWGGLDSLCKHRHNLPLLTLSLYLCNVDPSILIRSENEGKEFEINTGISCKGSLNQFKVN